MPDRSDSIFGALFGAYPQKAAPAADFITDANESATVGGHYSTAADLLHSPELEQLQDSDPLFAEPERFIAGYLSANERVGLSYPLPGPVSSFVVASAPLVIMGVSLVASGACTVQLFDGRDGSGRPSLQLPVPAAGLTMMFGRVLFTHGLFLQVLGGAAVDGGLIVERRVDSVPR